MEGQSPATSALQLSTFTKIKSIPVGVRLTAPGADQPVRIPADVVAAFDVSMSNTFPGRETMLELQKDTLALVIGKLGPGDRLAVLPFSDDVARDADAKEMEQLVAMSDQRKERIGKLVEEREHKPAGGTRFSKPLQEAEKILTNRDDVSRAPLILLLSDGGDESILRDKEWSRVSELKDPQLPVHTYGFCNHKADTMRHIAAKTKGTYFPDDIASIDDLPKFAAAFGGLVSRPFSAADVRVELTSVHPGASISKIEAGEKKASIGENGRSGYVDVGEISAGETTELTVYVAVADGDARSNEVEVLSVDGSYTQGWDGKPAKLGRSILVGGYKVQAE